MKGYISAYDQDNNLYCITIKTCELLPMTPPVINPKFALYYKTKPLKIQSILLLGPYQTGEIDDEIELKFTYIENWYLFKKGGVITDSNNFRIYKSKQIILREFELLKKRLNGKTYSGVLKHYLYDGYLRAKSVENNGNLLKFYEYHHNYVIKQYYAKNFSVVIDLQNNSKRKIKGIVSFGSIREKRYTVNIRPYLGVRITTWKRFRNFDIIDGFKNVCMKRKTKNKKIHSLDWDSFLCFIRIYQNNRIISNKIMGLFQLPEFKYIKKNLLKII
jgi:hypothetical protein